MGSDRLAVVGAQLDDALGTRQRAAGTGHQTTPTSSKMIDLSDDRSTYEPTYRAILKCTLEPVFCLVRRMTCV